MALPRFTTPGAKTDEPLWLYGYGSLIWRPGDVVHSERRVVCAKGWRRCFYQGSTDHRGTPGAPGRVVTLQRDPAAVTWGVALRLPPPGPARDAVVDYLEVREIQYDLRLRLDLYGEEEDEQPALRNACVHAGQRKHRRAPDTSRTTAHHPPLLQARVYWQR